MKPIRLEIENLRSFRKKRIISFEGMQLFAILGDTGAGKTSILEAITYALFNRSTWDGNKVKELIAKGTTTMSVTFVFSIDNDEFTVTRITKERGVSVHRLSCPSRSIDVSSEKQVKDAIQEALHLDAEGFLHTVLLPQGKHDELLTKDESKRNKILSELFRLDELSKVAGLAKVQEGRAEVALRGFCSEKGKLPAAPEHFVEEAQGRVAAAIATLQAVNAAVERARALDVAIAEKDKSLAAIGLRAQQLAGVDPIPALLAAIQRKADELQREADEHLIELRNGQETHAQAEREALVLRNSKLDRISVSRYESLLRNIESEAREMGREQGEKNENERFADEARTTLEALSTELGALEATHRAAKSQVSDVESELHAIRPRKDELERLAGVHAAAVRDRNVREAELKAKRAALVGADALVRAAEEAVSAAIIEQSRAVQAHVEARVAAGAAALAVHLHAGDSCPICERTLPDDFTTPQSRDLEKAKGEESDARRALRDAELAKSRIDAIIQSQIKAESECEAHLARCDAEVRQAVQALVAVLDNPSDDPAAVLVALKEKVVALDTSLPDLRQQRDTAATNAALVRNRYSVAEQQLKNHRDTVERLLLSLASRRDNIRNQIRALPTAFSPSEDLVQTDTARLALKEALAKASDVDDALTAANQTISHANAKLAEIERQRSELVVGPRSGLYERLRSIASILDADSIPAGESSQAKWATAIVSQARDEIERLQSVATSETLVRDSTAIARQKLVEEVGAEPHVAATSAALQLRDAETALLAAQSAAARAGELRVKIEKLEPAKVGLGTLKDALGARGFPSYATQQRQLRLLEVGSIILKDMTRGRYQFTKDFSIFDHDTNEARQPQTLSGGEKFLASLSLSLAVVEIAANAGAKIESLFLDEGFASLDAETLEMAMMELRKRSRAGRAICVISHLSQVTKFVTDTLHVEAKEEGTDVHHIDGPIDDEADVVEGLVTQLALRG